MDFFSADCQEQEIPYTSEASQYYDHFSTRIQGGAFSNEDASLCDCHGCGWILSQLDTWHECPCHPGKPHPEDAYDEAEYLWDDCSAHVTAWADHYYEAKKAAEAAQDENLWF